MQTKQFVILVRSVIVCCLYRWHIKGALLLLLSTIVDKNERMNDTFFLFVVVVSVTILQFYHYQRQLRLQRRQQQQTIVFIPSAIS